MGRYGVGARTTKGSRRISLRYLLDNGYLVKNKVVRSSLSWNDGSSIGMICYWGKNIYIDFSYTTTYGDNSTDMNYRMYLTKKKSNLGKGSVLYFECPVSGELCRFLYQAYGSIYFKSIKAYSNRIYYPSQISSKKCKGLEMSYHIGEKIQKLRSKIKKSHYRGEKTKNLKRLEKLEDRQDYYDEMNYHYLCRTFGRYIDI